MMTRRARPANCGMQKGNENSANTVSAFATRLTATLAASTIAPGRPRPRRATSGAATIAHDVNGGGLLANGNMQ